MDMPSTFLMHKWTEGGKISIHWWLTFGIGIFRNEMKIWFDFGEVQGCAWDGNNETISRIGDRLKASAEQRTRDWAFIWVIRAASSTADVYCRDVVNKLQPFRLPKWIKFQIFNQNSKAPAICGGGVGNEREFYHLILNASLPCFP